MPAIIPSEEELIDSNNSSYPADGIYVASLLIYSTHVTFLIKNTYSVEKSVYWKVHTTEETIDWGEVNIPANGSTTQIANNLSSSTQYRLLVVWGEAPNEQLKKVFTTGTVDSNHPTVQNDKTTAGPTDFTFLYGSIPTEGKVHDVVGYGLKITKISKKNVYYITPNHGVNICTTNLWHLFFSTSVLPNCVGFAHGRVKEIWGRCRDLKYIKHDDSGWYIADSNKRITGEIKGSDINDQYDIWNQYPQPPACNASKWWDTWPTANGWGKSQTPIVGAVMCWGGGWNGCGHVAVVEQVDASTGDVLVSEGYASSSSDKPGSIGHVNKYYKSNNYSLGGHNFKGFLISPICQITGSFNSFFMDDVVVEINELEVSKQDQATYNEIAHAHQTKITEALKLNDKVEIQWFGNTKADGKGRSIGNLTLVGLITNINRSAAFPYEVTVNKKIAGYYPRLSLVKTTSPLSVSLNSSLDSIQTNKNVAVTAQVMTDGLRIRSGPGTNYDELGYIAQGTVVNVYEIKTNGKYDWYKINKDHEQWIANTKDEHGNYWVQTLSASLVNDGEVQYKKYRFTTEVKVRTSPKYLADDSNVLPKPYKQDGEVVNVYQVNAQGQKPSEGEQTYWMYPPNGYDEDGYIWRRIGESNWVADDSRDGHWEVPLSYDPTPAPPVNPIKKLYLNPGIELKVRDFPGLNGNVVDTLQPLSNEYVEIGPWYNQQTNNGYTWYRISQYEDRWIADKYDTDIQGHYVTIK